MTKLGNSIATFDKIEANLVKLEKLWLKISTLIPEGLELKSGWGEYEDHCSDFEEIQKTMPTIGGYKLDYAIPGYNDICQWRVDAHEFGDPTTLAAIENDIHKQDEILKIYRRKFQSKRRDLVRKQIGILTETVDGILNKLPLADGYTPNQEVEGDQWEQFKECVAQIGILLGAGASSVNRWGDLARHIHFGTNGDLYDIKNMDWPEVRKGISDFLFDEFEPLPIDCDELDSLLVDSPIGKVSHKLNWGAIDADHFERLILNLIELTDGYENCNLLTHLNAADRGRDIEATKIENDSITGYKSSRVIIQCKHWSSKSINLLELTSLIEQMRLHEPPKVQYLIVANAGTYTADAVALAERRNQEYELPTLVLWSGNDLSRNLSMHPYLIAEYGLK